MTTSEELKANYMRVDEDRSILPAVPSWAKFDDMISTTYHLATYSDDPSTQNGALIVDELGIIGRGYNSMPSNTPRHLWDDRPQKLANVIHAEMAAILDAAYRGFSTAMTTMFCGWAACSNCAKHIERAGISRLVRHPHNWDNTNERWKEECLLGDDIMLRAGIEIIDIDPVPWNGVLRRNGSLWKP